MKIRLIVPECTGFADGYCADSWDSDLMEDARYYALEKAMDNPEVDLVVTSNNYFYFDEFSYVNAEPIINHILIKDYLNYIPENIRKPLVIGFDVYSNKSSNLTKSKNKSKGKSQKRKNPRKGLNPYGGIDAIVCFVFLDAKKKYQIGTYIWESWNDTGCDVNGFIAQNGRRVFTFKDMEIGLLSCGDIFSYCHNSTEDLPRADLYLNLTHTSFTGRYMRTPKSVINKKGAKNIFITMQTKDIFKYRQGYPWVFPRNTKQSVTTHHLGDSAKGYFAFVDCTV